MVRAKVSRGTVARAYVLAAVTHVTRDAVAGGMLAKPMYRPAAFCGGMLEKPVQQTRNLAEASRINSDRCGFVVGIA